MGSSSIIIIYNNENVGRWIRSAGCKFTIYFIDGRDSRETSIYYEDNDWLNRVYRMFQMLQSREYIVRDITRGGHYINQDIII